MPVSVFHGLTATTPDNPAYEIRPIEHWNASHAVSLSATHASEIFGAFSNDPTYNVSFSTIAGNKVVASANVTAAPSPVNVTGNGSSVNAQTIAFTNGNGITLGVSTAAGAATITGSHNGITTGRASNDGLGLNTAGSNVTWTANSSGLSLDARGYAGTATAITGAASVTMNSGGFSFNGAGMAGTTSGFTGANLSASITHNTAGLAISLSAGNYLTTAAASNHSHGNPTLALTNLSGTTASASNGLTLSLSAAAPGAATLTVSAVGNTTVNSSSSWANALSLRAYGILSAGMSGGSLLLSTPDPVDFTYMSVGNTNAGNTAGDTGVFSQRVVFHAGTNITLSGSSNGGSATFSIIGAAGGAGYSAGVSNVGNTAGNTGLTGSNLVLSGGNGVSLSQSTHANGATIGFSVNTSYAASNHSHGNPTLNLTNLSGTTASASNGLTLSLSAAAPQTGISGMIVSDATYTSGTVSFSGQNNITIGSSVNGASQYIRLSVGNYITTGRASNDAIGTNTAATNVTWTVNSSGLSFNASGYAGTATAITGGAVMTHNSAGFSFNGSALAGTGTAVTGGASITLNSTGLSFNGTALAGTATALTGAIAATVNSGGVSISVPATSSLVGSSGISISSNGSTITVGQVLGSYYDNFLGVWANSTTMQPLQSTSAIQPFQLEHPISFGFVRIPMSASMLASSTGATTGNSQFSYGLSYSHNLVIYSRGTGASSLSLQYVASTQVTAQQSINVSAAANSTQFSYTNRATYPMATGPVGFTYDYSSSAASLNFHTSGMTAITGQKMMDLPWATSLAPGAYWLMYGVSSASASQRTDQGSRLFNQFSQYGMSQPNIAFGTIGDNTHSSVQPVYGLGSFTTAGGGTTASLPISAVTSSASHNKLYFQLGRIA